MIFDHINFLVLFTMFSPLFRFSFICISYWIPICMDKISTKEWKRRERFSRKQDHGVVSGNEETRSDFPQED